MLLLLLVAGLGAARAVDVEIVDYYGEVKFIQGVAQDVSCTVEGLEEMAVISWTLGGRPLDPRQCSGDAGCLERGPNTRQEQEGDLLTQTLTWRPQVEEDGSELACRYGVPGEEPTGEWMDTIKILVYQQEFKVEEVAAVREGEPLTLSVSAVLYPAPRAEDLVWTVTPVDGGAPEEFLPGQQDPLGSYLAGPVRPVGDPAERRYSLDFTVLAMDRRDQETRFTLTVKTLEPARSFDLKTAMFLEPQEEGPEEEGPEEEGPQEEGQPPAENSEKPKDIATSNVGLFIIIGVLALCIILVIIYCVIRKRQKKGQTRAAEDGKGEFAAVGSKEPPAEIV